MLTPIKFIMSPSSVNTKYSGPFFSGSIKYLIVFCSYLILLHNHQYRLKELIIIFLMHKGQLDIDGNPSFLDQFLEDQTKVHLLDWVDKAICLTIVPIIFCFHQLSFLK